MARVAVQHPSTWQLDFHQCFAIGVLARKTIRDYTFPFYQFLLDKVLDISSSLLDQYNKR